MRIRPFLALLLTLGFSSPLKATELEYSFYSGYQGVAHSRIFGTDPGGVGAFDDIAAWEGRPFSMPPYYGARATWWTSGTFGFGVEFTHAKAYADDATRAALGFTRLEFSDGLNILTLNAFRAWPVQGKRFTPYIGGGLGVSLPHVDIESAGGTTFGYQLAGPAVTVMAGVSYALDDHWSLFGEYKGSYSMNKVTLASGGTLETNLAASALNLGVSYRY